MPACFLPAAQHRVSISERRKETARWPAPDAAPEMTIRRRLHAVIADDFFRVADLITAFDARHETFSERSAIIFAATLEFRNGIDRLSVLPKIMSASRSRVDEPRA